MWGESNDPATDLQVAIEFTGDHEHYGSYMQKVIKEWPISCENALTDQYINRRAWLGHAACALFARLPEYIVRQAWGYLTDEQQLLANKEASRAIAMWEWNQRKNQRVCENLGESMLLRWDS